jgi:hypothetical protein
MQRLSLAVVALLLLIGPAADAVDHEGARRFAIAVGVGSFGEQSSDLMRRKVGRSGCTVGSDVGWMWKLTGDLFTVDTTPDSPYSGTTVAHEGINILIDLSYHF